MNYKLKVINRRQGELLTEYINYLLGRAFELTDNDYKDNKKFMQYSKLLKGIIAQSNFYTEQTEMGEIEIRQWLFMTPNLMFHSFNGFVAGLGCADNICDEELMAHTFNTIKGLSDIEKDTELKSKFKQYDRDRNN
ncbi:MAG TPA: hypothetical protein DCS66_21530 [Flavobacteriaceae bacterium]|nr:hypothetical protein [Flavobacteriaceae bacterium]|tara:strand:+ start:1129 stop:1536 length:408 start_codon:yes stop_codon:yes gene_type:complete